MVAVLGLVGGRIRELRRERGWSRDALAQRAGLSVRFLAAVEAGSGNISLLRLHALAQALDTSVADLVRPSDRHSQIVVLVGLRGAGKTTVGPLLAARLGVPFIELDERIVATSGLSLGQIFELHGERYWRRLEHETIRRLLDADEPAVIAAAGGVVNEPASLELLCRRSNLVWLRARPEDHWNRVVAQGDRRPMADNPAAMDELRALLAEREPLYAQAALTVDTSTSPPEEVVRQIVAGLARVQSPSTKR